METRFVLIIFIFQVIKKTSALALSASLEVLSASLHYPHSGGGIA
jgi:hypothetical protein